MAGDIVAEKSRVCRFTGRSARILRMAGRNPMSSIRSASSRTRIRTELSDTSFRFARSSIRPGVATITWAFAAALAWAGIPTPP